MRPIVVAFVVVAAGCAGRHTVVAPPRAAHAPIALESVDLAGPRIGPLSASREWQRTPSNRVVHEVDDEALRASFTRSLERRLPLDPAAPLHLHATLTLQDTADYEGLAAETTDVTLHADLIAADGAVYRSITLREPASAPLQRSASRKARLEAALDRLAQRLAAQL